MVLGLRTNVSVLSISIRYDARSERHCFRVSEAVHRTDARSERHCFRVSEAVHRTDARSERLARYDARKQVRYKEARGWE